MRSVLLYCHTCQWCQVPMNCVFGTWHLSCIRMFLHRRFGLFQFVTMSTPVRDAPRRFRVPILSRH
jgi:hypothetical protein